MVALAMLSMCKPSPPRAMIILLGAPTELTRAKRLLDILNNRSCAISRLYFAPLLPQWKSVGEITSAYSSSAGGRSINGTS